MPVVKMPTWTKWGLGIVGGVTGLWILWRAFFRRPEIEKEDVPVPLLTPSLRPGEVAGVSEFPSQVGAQAGFNALDLLKFERETDEAAAIRAEELRQRQRQEAEEEREELQQEGILRTTWKQVNKRRLAQGKKPITVCITTKGGIGIGGKQCEGATIVYGGV